jgi:hypothetical protein
MVKLGRVFLELISGITCAFGGLFLVFYALHYILWPFDLDIHADVCAYTAMLLGIAMGSVFGIWLVDKIIFKSEGYKLPGTVIGFLTCGLGVILAIWFLRTTEAEGNVAIYLPLIGSCFALIGYKAKKLFTLFICNSRNEVG